MDTRKHGKKEKIQFEASLSVFLNSKFEEKSTC